MGGRLTNCNVGIDLQKLFDAGMPTSTEGAVEWFDRLVNKCQEVDDLRTIIDRQAVDVEELRLIGRVMDRSIADLMTERNRLRAALKAVEFPASWGECPWCWSPRERHKPN